MIKAIVGAGGKTSIVRELTAQYRAQGRSVFVATSTHMFLEEDTLVTEDPQAIIARLKETGYVMAGPADGIKLCPLPEEVYRAVCACADEVLVEADGSRHHPLKYPNSTEPVIPENTDEILVVCGLHGLGQKAKDACHRLELVPPHLEIREDTVITPVHVQRLVTEGYLKPLREKYPDKKITLVPRHDGSDYQQRVAEFLIQEV